MKYIFILLAFLYSNICQAQYITNARLDKTQAYIGDPIHLTILAVGPANAQISLPTIDTFDNFEIISIGKIDTAITTNNKRIEQEYLIVSFDTGKHLIPSFQFSINQQKLYSDEIEVDIRFLPTDVSGEFKDIHTIEAVPPPPSKFWWWFTGIALVVALIVYLLNKIKSKPKPAKISKQSSYEETIKQLQLLRKVQYPSAADYQVLINILRGYLNHTQGFPATGQTNYLLFRFVQNLKLSLEHVNALKSTLNAASVSVFALRKQSNEQWQTDISNVSNIITQLNANKI